MRNSRKRNYAPAVIIILIIIALFVFIRFFNGNLLYFSTGLNKNSLLKVDNSVTSTMQADILLSDAKLEYEEIFGEDVWNKNIGDLSFNDYVKDKVKTKLIRVKCMNIMAEEKGIVLGRTEKEKVEQASQEYMAGLTKEQIDKYGITKEKVQTMFTEFAIADILYNSIVETYDCEISSDEARVIKIQYICSESYENIQNAKNSLDSGESFYVVTKKLGQEDNEYECKRGEFEEGFENTAFNLKTGETSEIIESQDKYYIIKCTSDNQKSKTESNKAAMLSKKQLDMFNASFENYESKKYVEFNNWVWKKKKVKDSLSLSIHFDKVYKTYFS